jgi:hypothetical protein
MRGSLKVAPCTNQALSGLHRFSNQHRTRREYIPQYGGGDNGPYFITMRCLPGHPRTLVSSQTFPQWAGITLHSNKHTGMKQASRFHAGFDTESPKYFLQLSKQRPENVTWLLGSQWPDFLFTAWPWDNCVCVVRSPEWIWLKIAVLCTSPSS